MRLYGPAWPDQPGVDVVLRDSEALDGPQSGIGDRCLGEIGRRQAGRGGDGLRGRCPVAQEAIPVGVQIECWTARGLHELVVAAPIVVEAIGETCCRMQRLMQIADKMQQPDQIIGLQVVARLRGRFAVSASTRVSVRNVRRPDRGPVVEKGMST